MAKRRSYPDSEPKGKAAVPRLRMRRRGLTAALPYYFRPQMVKIDTPNPDKLTGNSMEQVAPNIWRFALTKRYGRRDYISTLIIKNGKDYYEVKLPTDNKGNIPMGAMVERLMDVTDGDRKGRERNLFVDIGISAKNTHDAKDKAKAYLWYLYPNEGDIKGIDDVNTKIATILPKASKRTRRSIILTGGTPEQRDMFVKALDDNFTNREKEVLAGVMYMIKSEGGHWAGSYSRARILGEGGSVAIIQVDPLYMTDTHATSIIIHEAVHALRDRDTKRRKELRRRSLSMVGRDVDLEESMTEGETTARENPLRQDRSAQAGVGYYKALKTGSDKTITDLVREDRLTLTRPKNAADLETSGKRGKRAEKAMVEHYPETNIAHLKIKGATEAIDTYYETRDKDGRIVNTQVYSAKGKPPDKPAGSKKTVEFHDGKAKVVDSGGRKVVITRRMVNVNAQKTKKPRKGRTASSGVRDLGGGIVESRIRGRTRRHVKLS